MSLLDSSGAVTGDIWCSGAFSFESPLKDLLDSGNYKLEDLLGEDELLQELRGVHPELIRFFSTPQAVTGLVKYIIVSPRGTILDPDPSQRDRADAETETDAAMSTWTDEGTRANGGDVPSYSRDQPLMIEDDGVEAQEKTSQRRQDTDTVFIRYPYMACEVICCEIDPIIDTLVFGSITSDDASVHAGANFNSNSNAYAGSSGAEGGTSDDGITVVAQPQSILDLLFSLLLDSKEGEIDDYRAGYFDKVLSVLFRKRPQEMSQYINEGGCWGSPELMAAMFRHLYSHSIMQILQRLLLPQPPPPPPPPPQPAPEDQQGGMENHEGYPDEAEMQRPTDGVDYFRCDWSSSRASLETLLACLVGEHATPATADDEERLMSLYQNASEVLITIIQNSPLTSNTLHVLTTDPILRKLMTAASYMENVNDFSPHDSRLTCTLNVLESLILQLGGYGSVGTVVMMNGPETASDSEANEAPQFAVSETLILHLPQMLQSLHDLLLCPAAEGWMSPMQMSRLEPIKILGSSRLRIVRLLESLVLLGDPKVDSMLCQSDCLEVCLDLFWKFQWCSMLHQSVANLLVHVFEGADARSELQEYFMRRCNLMRRLIKSFSLKEPHLEVSGETVRDAGALGGSEGAAPRSIIDDGGNASTETQGGQENTVSAPEPTNSPTSAMSTAESFVPGQDLGAESTDITPSQSLRLGYMGHVIIICQALVHACSLRSDQQDEYDIPESRTPIYAASNARYESDSRRDNGQDKIDPFGNKMPEESRDAYQRNTEGDSNPLINSEQPLERMLYLADLIESHPLRSEWHDFVNSTLATETSIQSTPLGGFHLSPVTVDPLHSQRPSLMDGNVMDDDDDGESAPAMPEIGVYGSGDINDMDDNDLENMVADMDENDLDVAASMMAGLNIHRNVGDGDLSHVLASSVKAPVENYDFDDPLGSRRFDDFAGGSFGRSNSTDDEGSDGNSSHSSSDDEASNMSETTKDSADSGIVVVDGVSFQGDGTPLEGKTQAPVMNLFAGNFDSFDQHPTSDTSGWSNFANFDDAFANAEPVTNGVASNALDEQILPVAPTTGTVNIDNDAGKLDEIFGTSSGQSSFSEAFENPEDEMPLQERLKLEDAFADVEKFNDDTGSKTTSPTDRVDADPALA